jgi:hypothetical protein
LHYLSRLKVLFNITDGFGESFRYSLTKSGLSSFRHGGGRPNKLSGLTEGGHIDCAV